MTRFTELLKTGEVHSAYEDLNMTTSVPDTAPASVEDLVNPPKPDFSSMSKLELESFCTSLVLILPPIKLPLSKMIELIP